MKTIASILIALLISSCGSGMIGLLEDDHDIKIMTDTLILRNGCSYYIVVEEYSEYKNVVSYSSLKAWKQCNLWEIPVALEEPFPALIMDFLHEQYLIYEEE